MHGVEEARNLEDEGFLRSVDGRKVELALRWSVWFTGHSHALDKGEEERKNEPVD